MRERHFPRLCRTCDAPMSRQEETCWRCGAAWSSPRSPGRLRVITTEQPAAVVGDETADRGAAVAVG